MCDPNPDSQQLPIHSNQFLASTPPTLIPIELEDGTLIHIQTDRPTEGAALPRSPHPETSADK
ncbi:MAG: hypothetical protein O3A14_13575 [Cyanobacteria bacterium]|nr:hypothetical protein [Cyanobacteriota bacterium]